MSQIKVDLKKFSSITASEANQKVCAFASPVEVLFH